MTHDSDNLSAYPTNRVIRLRNDNCAYCGRTFGADLAPTREHVIGRRFVPKGTLDGVFNLHLRACQECNNGKSALEDDISVITMCPDTMGRFPSDDERLRAEVARKARKSVSRRTGKPVADGEPPFIINGNMMGIQMTFTMRGPPQVDEGRAFRLAWFQLQGFLYFLTYNEAEKRGRFFPGPIHPVAAVRQADWGNPQIGWFEHETADWLPRLNLITADEYFKMWIKRKADTAKVWAFAIEWNRNFRLVGFIGDAEEARIHLDAVPPLDMQVMHESPTRSLRTRIETPLKREDDTLFDFPCETYQRTG